MRFEIVGYRDRLVAIAHGEHGIAGASVAQLFNDNGTFATSMASDDSHVADEFLQTKPVSVTKSALGRECSGVVLLEKFHEEGEQWSRLVHYSRGYVDVDIHLVLGRTDGLEVSPP